jgi:ankyrin repeat protein
MKKYRNLSLILLVLLFFVGMPVGLVINASRCDDASRDLIISIKLDDIEGAMAALKAGADPNTRDHSEDKPLSFMERTKQLCRKAFPPHSKPEYTDEHTALTLHLQTSKQDNPVFVKALLDAGADPNLEGPGAAPLLYANGLGADRNRIHKESIHLLVQHGADVNAKTLDGWTVLYFATTQDDIQIVQFLIDHGADVNAQDRRLKVTPLIATIESRRSKMAQFLIEYHADLNLRDVYGRTALDYAKRRNQPQREAQLIERGARTGLELDAGLHPGKK